ncbi:uncharacterized protein isoform X2 [Rhodnius prolixus]|uniref:uncharacterized protein isoform X2 n=1 Tax=Rhodnius prolixus TaxID=13249 RepID=UPI003D18DDB2
MFKENLVCLTSLTIFIVFFIECVANDSLINCGHKNSNHGISSYFCPNPGTINGSKCSIYDKQCSNWCQNPVNWTVINSEIGLVEFSLFVSPSTCCHSVLKISLYVFDKDQCNDKETCDCVHSVKRIQKSCNKSISSEIMTFQAKYVFTSLYHLEIKPHVGKNAMQPCITDKMFIETNYVKQLIGNTELGIQYDYKSHSQELNFGINGGGNGLHLAEQVYFKLLPGCWGNLGVTIFLKNGEDSGECCKRNYTKISNCSCNWVNNILLCSFSEIQPGNYCVTVELEDPRCARPTLWAKSAKSCQWSNIYNISDSTGALVPFKPPSVRLGEHKTLIWISTVGCISVILAVIICVYFKSYPKKIYHHYVSCAPLHTQQLSSINKPKILLLYPRDCEHFMNVMETFRSLLQEFLHAQVYDVWDIENWDTVNEAGYQWIFKYLTDKSIKVIVIASQCSKLFEIALINQKGIEYRGEPHCFDNLFLYSLKESLTLVSCSTDNYNRFFVVRLEEPGCEENRFGSITPCTVYTIPEHLKDLTLEIHNMDPGEVILNPEETSKILQFSKSLDELKQFKLNNPNYLNDLINLIDENR